MAHKANPKLISWEFYLIRIKAHKIYTKFVKKKTISIRPILTL
jgi:hypothetical protein